MGEFGKLFLHQLPLQTGRSGTFFAGCAEWGRELARALYAVGYSGEGER
jgi:hypothetical protein